MAQLCPHCKNSTQFKVTLTAEGVVELKNDSFELISQGDLGIQEGTLVCASCGQPVAQDQLVPALECSDCHVITPVADMVQLEGQNGAEGPVICNGCYTKMTAPTPESMSKEELLALNANKDAEMEALKKEMEAMKAQMAKGSAPAKAKATAPVAQQQASQPAPIQTAPQVQQTPPVQEQVVETNLPMPTNEAVGNVNIIDPGAVPNEEQPPSFFGGEAPF